MNPKLSMAGRAARTGAHVVKERVRAPRLLTAQDVPGCASDMKADWLTAVLCKDHPGARVRAFSCPGGSSGSSERMALRVEYNDVGVAAGLPTQLYTKSTKSFRQRLLLGGAGILEGETQFFLNFRPKVDMEAPFGFWGGVHDASWRSMVVLEDISATKGAQFNDPTTALTRTQVEDVLRNMAAYHGAWWEAPELSALKTPRQWFATISGMLSMGKRHAVGMQRARDVIPPSLQGQAARLWAGSQKGLLVCTDLVPRTLLHGDSHAGQLYRTADGRMGITDWQTVMQGGWSYDVAYFIGSACDVEDRRAWEKDLLAFYLDELAAAGGKAPDFNEALLRYRQSLFYPLSAWTFTIGRAFYQPKMQPDESSLAIIRRLAAAIEDLDCFDAVEV